MQKRAILRFPGSLIQRPIISKMIRQFEVDVNILRASISENEDGRMLVVFEGDQERLSRALDYLRENQIGVVDVARYLVWDEEACVHCGACLAQCPSSAFEIDERTRSVVFHSEKCIACDLCIPSCGYAALETTGHYETGGQKS